MFGQHIRGLENLEYSIQRKRKEVLLVFHDFKYHIHAGKSQIYTFNSDFSFEI